ncbi:unnamed protein product [Ranitomeya imitator]|uniref:Uncharacterized protein n=1 Tax=Ranitomeya imitator TaxID=111125 RepID=A0ABN9M0P1_9NEOB|nr:unnamed protein product [Ranitomeya imitator]
MVWRALQSRAVHLLCRASFSITAGGFTPLLMPEDPKRPRREERLMAPRIGTHNGTFHCDEALACYLLRTLEPYRRPTCDVQMLEHSRWDFKKSNVHYASTDACRSPVETDMRHIFPDRSLSIYLAEMRASVRLHRGLIYSIIECCR